MAKIPVRIVTEGSNVSGGLGHRSLGPDGALVLESALPAGSISGGVIPMTIAEFAAASGSAAIASLAPAAWFRFGQGITVTGAGVSQWDDASGNSRHLKQGTDTNRPALQADGSILFDGADNFLKCDAFTFSQPNTLYLLARQVTWTSGDHIFDGNTVSVCACLQSGLTPAVVMFAGSGAGSNAGFVLNTYAPLAIVFNGASSLIQVGLGTPTTGNPGAQNMGGLTLGAAGNGSAFSNIQVKELIGFAGAHDAATRALVVGYLSRLGGL